MHPKRNPDIVTKLLPDGHAVLFSPNNNWAHTITPLAAVAWEFCDGTNSTDDISTRVAEIAESQPDPELTDKVKTLIRELQDSGLLLA